MKLLISFLLLSQSGWLELCSLEYKLMHTALEHCGLRRSEAFAPGASVGSIILVAIMFPEAGIVLSFSFDLWDAHCLADLHWSEPGGWLKQGVYQRASLWVVWALTLDVSVPPIVQVFLRTVFVGTVSNTYLRALRQRIDKCNAGGHSSTVCIYTYTVQKCFPVASCQSLTEGNCANSIHVRIFCAGCSIWSWAANLHITSLSYESEKKTRYFHITWQTWMTQIWNCNTTWAAFHWLPQDSCATCDAYSLWFCSRPSPVHHLLVCTSWIISCAPADFLPIYPVISLPPLQMCNVVFRAPEWRRIPGCGTSEQSATSHIPWEFLMRTRKTPVNGVVIIWRRCPKWF